MQPALLLYSTPQPSRALGAILCNAMESQSFRHALYSFYGQKER